jgi:hypothetical protein
MKRNLLLLSALFLISVAHAQFVDFGTDYDIQKGDFAVGDIDDDGDLDIIFSGDNNGGTEKGAILINDGSGNFTSQTGDRVIKMGKSGNIQFGDIDGDGDLDVIFAGWGTSASPSIGIALNDGQGNFTLANSDSYPINPATTVTSAGFADFNLDGLLDYYYFGNGVGNCIIYFHQADGSFQASTASFGTCDFVEPEVTVVDFDNNGYPDIFITAYDNITATRFSSLFKNDGFGTFTQYAGVDIYRKKANGTSSWGDFNGDGYLDLLLNGDGWLNSGEDNDGIVRIYKNNAGLSAPVAATFEWYRQNGVGNGSVIVDWDNDGKLDFIIGGWNANTSKQETALYVNTNPANFEFTKSPLTDTYFPGISEQGFRVADLNGDNKVDLLLCGYSGGTMALNRRIAGYVLNQSSKASVVPGAPTNLNAVVDQSSGVMVTLTWQAPASEAAKFGTTYNLSLKNTTTGKWFYNPMAVVGGSKNGWRKVAGRMGNVFANTEFELYDLPAGEYEWTVQAINGAYLGGAFADTKTFTIQSTAVSNPVAFKPVISSIDNHLKIIVDNSALKNRIRIYEISGQLLTDEEFAGVYTKEMKSGIYLVKIENASGIVNTKVIVK